MTRAYVGLGSNLGDREAAIRRALELLGGRVRVVAVSSVRETTPWGLEDQPRFLNAAAAVQTELSARELLAALLAIERELGRTREGPRWGPRTIDLDLLLYGNEVVDEPGLTVPHPRLAERSFVLEPLYELDPELRLPDGRRLAYLLTVARAVSSRRRAPRIPSSLWTKALAGFALAALVAAFLPNGDGEGAPPVRTLVLSASLITLFTTTALYLGLRRDLGLTRRIAVYAVAYNALIVTVKFVLAPHGLYEVNEQVELKSLFPVSDLVGASWTALVVFALYIGGLWTVYRLAGRRLALARNSRERTRRIVLPLVGGTYALAGAGAVLAMVVLVAQADTVNEYLSFVFASGVSLLIAIALAGAGALAALGFKDTAERAEVVGDAALLVSFFWVGVAFLALYHALWVLYVLVLVSIWPLKVVVPK